MKKFFLLLIGEFEERNKVLEPSIIIINYSILITINANYIVQLGAWGSVVVKAMCC
jgi:hypothetical protein